MAVGGAATADASGAEESSASEAKKSSSSASPVLAAIAGPGAVEGKRKRKRKLQILVQAPDGSSPRRNPLVNSMAHRPHHTNLLH